MTKEHETIKEVFTFLLNNPESDSHGLYNNGDDFEDHLEYVMYHSNGYRVDFTKERFVDPTEEGFSWKDHQLRPEDFDDLGFLYTYYSWVSEDGFKDIDIFELKKLLGL